MTPTETRLRAALERLVMFWDGRSIWNAEQLSQAFQEARKALDATVEPTTVIQGAPAGYATPVMTTTIRSHDATAPRATGFQHEDFEHVAKMLRECNRLADPTALLHAIGEHWTVILAALDMAADEP